MNPKTVEKLIKEISELPLNLLQAQDLKQIDRVLRKNIDTIRRLRIQEEIDSFWKGLPARARDFLPVILKKHSMKPPKKSDPPEAYENYFKKLKMIWKREGPTIEGLEAKIRRISQYKEVEALNELRSLSAVERKELSKYAGLSILKAGKPSPLNLSSSNLRNRQWLDALKKQRRGLVVKRKR